MNFHHRSVTSRKVGMNGWPTSNDHRLQVFVRVRCELGTHECLGGGEGCYLNGPTVKRRVLVVSGSPPNAGF